MGDTCSSHHLMSARGMTFISRLPCSGIHSLIRYSSCGRAGWFSVLLLESRRDAVEPPGSRTLLFLREPRGGLIPTDLPHVADCRMA